MARCETAVPVVGSVVMRPRGELEVRGLGESSARS